MATKIDIYKFKSRGNFRFFWLCCR